MVLKVCLPNQYKKTQIIAIIIFYKLLIVGEEWPSFLAPVLPAPSSAPSIANPDHVPNSNSTQSPQQPAPSSACITYHRVPWRLRVRKEVFSPGER